MLPFENILAITVYLFQSANPVMITPANNIHILWLIPQYVVMTMGEVMFSVTGLEFSFTQAPISMKSVLQSVWLLTVAFGNLIVVLIVEGNFLDAQVIIKNNLIKYFLAYTIINRALHYKLLIKQSYQFNNVYFFQL